VRGSASKAQDDAGCFLFDNMTFILIGSLFIGENPFAGM
jgi:hypothetical protein